LSERKLVNINISQRDGRRKRMAACVSYGVFLPYAVLLLVAYSTVFYCILTIHDETKQARLEALVPFLGSYEIHVPNLLLAIHSRKAIEVSSGGAPNQHVCTLRFQKHKKGKVRGSRMERDTWWDTIDRRGRKTPQKS
jgi:hypothetical protein